MKKQLDIKKLLLLNLPYILMGLFATNFGEAWRMAVGADASAKMLSFFSTLPVALASWWPSLHPLDLLVGLCCGAGLRLAVYLKSKNAKKYRHGMEYGSARCLAVPKHHASQKVYPRPPGTAYHWQRTRLSWRAGMENPFFAISCREQRTICSVKSMHAPEQSH